MTTITIPLANPRFAELTLRAELSGLTPEEYLQRLIEEVLDRPEEFRAAADHILKKNAERHRRLA